MGMANAGFFPISSCGQRNGRRALDPSGPWSLGGRRMLRASVAFDVPSVLHRAPPRTSASGGRSKFGFWRRQDRLGLADAGELLPVAAILTHRAPIRGAVMTGA